MIWGRRSKFFFDLVTTSRSSPFANLFSMAFLPRSRLFLEKTLTSLQAGEALSATKPHELFPVKVGNKVRLFFCGFAQHV